MLEIERENWMVSRGMSSRRGEAYSPDCMAERQIAALFRGRRYEDAVNIPASDRRPLPRYFW